MLDRPSADRTAELLFWYARKPSRYEAEGRRRDAPRLDPEVILKVALGRPVQFADATWNDPSKVDALQQAACAYVRQLFFRPDPTPYQVLGLEPGASLEAIKESFRLLMQLVHPDRQGEKRRWPDACAAQANWAYSMLRDQDTRRTLEGEADARTALARAINRAAMAAEAPQMPVITWPKKSGIGREPTEHMLPEWLTAGVGGCVRQHPAATAFGALITVAALIIGASLWEGRAESLVRVARDQPSAPKAAAPTPTQLPMPVSERPAAATVRPADPAPPRSTIPPSDQPIVLASNVPRVAVGRASDDSAPAPVTHALPGASTPAAAAVSSVSAAPRVTATALDPKPSPVPANVPADGASLPRAEVPVTPVPAPQLVARVDAAPAPDPTPVSVAVVAPPIAVPLPPVAAPSPPLVAAPLPPADAEVEALFADFVDAYERGRLDAFAALFDEDADTNLRRGRTAIRGEYDELFRLSQWRRMQLTRISWRPVGDHTVAIGELTVKIGWRDGREVEQRVNVDMELVRRDGRVVIARLSHHPKNP